MSSASGPAAGGGQPAGCGGASVFPPAARWLFSGLFFCGASFAGAGERPFHLEPPLKRDVLDLLGKAKDFHSAFERGDSAALQREAERTRQIIRKVYAQILFVPHFQQRIHAHRLLRAMEDQLSPLSLQKAAGGPPGRRRRVKKLFGSFFELAHVYGLKGEMEGQMFYCPKDKSAWIQSGGKPRNPVSSGYKNCGRRLLL